MKSYFFALLAMGLMMVSCGEHQDPAELLSQAKEELKAEQAQKEEALKTLVQQFYDKLSTTPGDQTAAETASFMADNWKSTPTPQGGANLDGFVKTLFMFHGMIPDLKWKVEEMLVSGNQVIVRSRATGSPNSPEGYFFGVPTDGNKSFDVQTIDIHTIEDGKLVSAYHCEDWARAIQQVSAATE